MNGSQMLLTTEQLHILQHSLGCDQYGRGTMYRNRFVTDADSHDGRICSQLVEAGLMERRSITQCSGDSLFWVTEAGIAEMKAESPRPPKMTAGQRRYLDYLKAGSGLKFGEWLKASKGN